MNRSTTIPRRPRRRKAPGTKCYGSVKCRRDAEYVFADRRLCVVHMADALARAFVIARDGVCLRCGAPEPLQWAHIVPGRHDSFRWRVAPNVADPANYSLALCQPCHFWQTNNPLQGDAFFESLGIDVCALRREGMRLPVQDPRDVIAALADLRGGKR